MTRQGGGSMTEREIVLLAKNGDVDAFCMLYGKYKKKLYGYAYYKLGNQSDAEDAVSDCVLSAYEQIGNLKNPDAFSSWIFRILYCSCASAVKTQIFQRKTDNIDDIQNDLSVSDKTAINTELRQALTVLSAEEKDIVLLAAVAGLRSKEIAKISGLTAGSVRSKLSRSLAKMKNELV